MLLLEGTSAPAASSTRLQIASVLKYDRYGPTFIIERSGTGSASLTPRNSDCACARTKQGHVGWI